MTTLSLNQPNFPQRVDIERSHSIVIIFTVRDTIMNHSNYASTAILPLCYPSSVTASVTIIQLSSGSACQMRLCLQCNECQTLH